MNPATFKSMLTPEMGTNNVTDTDHAAQILADAYDLANIGSSCTFFGSTVISGDKDTLKKFIKLAFDTNKTTNTKEGFILMATGFCAYWLKAIFTPLPTLPPTISPLKGTTVLFPGEPTELEKDLIKAFDQPEFEMFTDTLYNALVAHHTKIAGTYNGLVPAFPSPIPAILPWVAILSAPLPDTGTSGTSGTNGTSGGDNNGTNGSNGTSGTNGTNGTSGTNGTNGTSGTNGTNGTSGTNGTNGTSGTNGTNGTNGTSGTNGTNGTSGTNGTRGTGGTSGTSGEIGMGGFKTNGVSDYRVKLRLSNIVRSVDGKYNADWIVRFALSDFPRPLPDPIKRDIAFNTKLQREIGNLKGQEMNRLYYIFDNMIEQKNLELDEITGYVKYGSVKITQ